jgi:arylsulfatase A-like enzyme
VKPLTRRGGTPTELRLWVTVYTLAAGFFVGMEWLFFVTKPSFLNVFTWTGQVRVFGAALLPVLAVGAMVLVVLRAAGGIPLPPLQLGSRLAMRALPTLVLSASALLLADNFTTTLVGWGIASLRGGRLPYAAGVLCGVAIVWHAVGRWAAAVRSGEAFSRFASVCAVGLVWVAGAGTVVEFVSEPLAPRQEPGRPLRRPNILLVGIDGVNADHLSVYGYGRPTSPSLEVLARDALVFTNAYSNAANTAGALTAILTGRLPTDTRVIFAPDILRGEPSVLHLPGLLRAFGYRTGQFAVRHYAASTDFNLRHGFDVVNGRAVGSDTVITQTLLGVGSGGYFLDQMVQRVSTRVALLAGHRERPPFAEVTESMAAQYMDDSRLRQLEAFLTGTPQPWFAHIHLMVTHGAKFSPREQHFSAGQAQAADWMIDFYDDAILDADRSIGTMIALLRQRGLLDEALIIVYSDHAQGFGTDRAVPLLVRLPQGARRHERIGQTVQSIDVAPTIVDALGLRVPGWMGGQSLIGAIPPCRPVFGAIAAAARVRFKGRDYTPLVPPFFSLGAVSLVHGQQWFVLGLEGPKPTMTDRVIPLLPGAIGACNPLTAAVAKAAISDHLRFRGYDIDTHTTAQLP